MNRIDFDERLHQYNMADVETFLGLRRDMQQATCVPAPIKSNFSDLSPEDILYEVMERKHQVLIVRRKVEKVQRMGKKIHFVLYPCPDSENQTYSPYSNRNWAMSKKFNPIFMYYDDAIRWIHAKLRKDEMHYRYLLDNIINKRAHVENLLTEMTGNFRYATYADSASTYVFTSPISNHSGVVFL